MQYNPLQDGLNRLYAISNVLNLFFANKTAEVVAQSLTMAVLKA